MSKKPPTIQLAIILTKKLVSWTKPGQAFMPRCGQGCISAKTADRTKWCVPCLVHELFTEALDHLDFLQMDAE